ncbi:hypothetical protein NE475_20100, partial [Ruthenibacterium lactatiformans]|nr:hypothetical protein [Ruthenibacterium lactatiformans]
VNEWYLEDLSNNVRSVLSHKRREGKFIGSSALYGYQKDPVDKNHLVIDPEAAEVVKRIFALYLAGLFHTTPCSRLYCVGEGTHSSFSILAMRVVPLPA